MLTQFMQRVVADAARYQDRRNAVRAGILERILTRRIPTDYLHPNPGDEFSDAKIGPNDEIISHYVEEISRCKRNGLPIFEEPVIVQKMGKREYMLLNGHHRWAAAVKTSTKRLHAVIVNRKRSAGSAQGEERA